MKEGDKLPVPKWLEDLQQKSWEPEILLSGIVLYGMFKVPDLLDQFLFYFKQNIFGNSQDIDNLVSLFKMGIYWLIGGLILHLICRGIWIGMVGLSYTFPDGIDKDKLKYQGKFREKVDKTPTYEAIVIRLEKICSSLFSISFMLFMSLIGGYFFFFVLVIFPFLTLYIYFDIGFNGAFYNGFQMYVLLIVIIGLIGLADFLTMGYCRRYKWFNKIYWPIHSVISFLTLSRFYRPIYYGMVSHFNKWAFFSLLTVFVFVSIVGAGQNNSGYYPGDSYSRLVLWDNSSKHSVYQGYYQDQNEQRSSVMAQIPSDVISGNVLRLFVVSHIEYEDEMLELMSIDSLREVYPDTTYAHLQIMVVNNYYSLMLDTTDLDQPEWYFHYNEKTAQRGYMTYLDITDLNQGLHSITVKIPTKKGPRQFVKIPFYRDVTQLNKPRKSRDVEPESVDFQPKPFGIRE